MFIENEKYYTKPTTKKEARHNIKSFWFNLFEEQKGTVYDNLTDRTKTIMQLLYQELSIFDNRIRKDMKKTFNTDRSRYWKEYVVEYPDKKIKKQTLKIRKTRQELRAINERIQDKEQIQQEKEQQIAAQEKQIQEQNEELTTIKKEQISYIAQQGFLQEFSNTKFYKKNTTAILNMQAIINNYIKKAFDANFENYDKKFILGLMEKHNQLLMAFGIDKLMQLQPQAMITLYQQINNDNKGATNNSFNLLCEKLNNNKK